MPNPKISPIENFDQLIDAVKTSPFPADATVRLTVTGLAFCTLKIPQSEIKFLTHVESHELKMAIIRRVRQSDEFYPDRTYKIEPGEQIDLEVVQSPDPPKIETTGNYPLEEMVNLAKIHGDNSTPKQIKYIGPSDPLHPHFPTALIIKRAAFFTRAVHQKLFTFTERGIPENTNPPNEIGYILGGTIANPPPGKVEVMLTCTKGSFPNEPFDTPGVVYDIILDNHCARGSTDECNSKVVSYGGERGTDFFYYYDLLREENNIYRQFLLEHVEAPVRQGGGEEEGEEGELPGGSGEVAACNPIIVEPPPS
jgi:hypothetical protein